MSTVVSICNIALSRAGGGKILSLEDKTKEAYDCNVYYESTRDMILRAFDWSFARKRQILPELTEKINGWNYAYQLPSDYIIARKVKGVTVTGQISTQRTASSGQKKIKFEISSNTAGTRPVLLSNISDIELTYTAKITDSNAFDPLFTEALSYKLASEFAISLKGKPAHQADLFKMYLMVLGQAKAESANEDNNNDEEVNLYVGARN